MHSLVSGPAIVHVVFEAAQVMVIACFCTYFFGFILCTVRWRPFLLSEIVGCVSAVLQCSILLKRLESRSRVPVCEMKAHNCPKKKWSCLNLCLIGQSKVLSHPCIHFSQETFSTSFDLPKYDGSGWSLLGLRLSKKSCLFTGQPLSGLITVCFIDKIYKMISLKL